MKDRPGQSRRQFLKHSATALTAGLAFPAIVPSSVLAAEARPLPSNRIAVGCIGTGGMGMGNLKNFLNDNQVQLLAVCDVDSKRLESARATVEDYYKSQNAKYGSQSLPSCQAYNDFRDLVSRNDLDAVVISTPDHWHTLCSLYALRSGKDVYCEKPLTLTIEEGRVLSDTAREYGRVFQTGSQQRSDRLFRFACELVRNGRIGKLHTIRVRLPEGREIAPQAPMPVPPELDYDLWLGQAPWSPYTATRCHYNFRFNFDYAGGQITNWGAHHLDIAQWGNGTERGGPVEVKGQAKFPTKGIYNVPVEFKVEYTYADGVTLIAETKGADVRFEGDKGKVIVSRGSIDADPKSLLNEVIGPDEIHLYASNDHKKNFLDCIRSRAEAIACAEIGHRSATVCHLGNIAMILGRTLKWNPDVERFVDDPDADRFISRPMRAPWRL